jgi:DNA replication protein DnaC
MSSVAIKKSSPEGDSPAVRPNPLIQKREQGMLLEQTKDQLRTLKLTGFLEALEQQLEQPHTHELAFENRLGFLVEREVLYRDNRRLARLLSNAKLREPACVEDINYAHPRGLDKSRMASLVQLDWVRSGLNLCITGKTGCGKTWLACAIGNQSCRQGLVTRYFRLPRLLEQLRISHGDGSYARLMMQLLKTDLLILDDWGMQPLDTPQRQDLMELIEDRHGRRSTLIASQLPVKHWHDYIGEATMSDAILDRLLHGSHRLELEGDSMRKLSAEKADPTKELD